MFLLGNTMNSNDFTTDDDHNHDHLYQYDGSRVEEQLRVVDEGKKSDSGGDCLLLNQLELNDFSSTGGTNVTGDDQFCMSDRLLLMSPDPDDDYKSNNNTCTVENSIIENGGIIIIDGDNCCGNLGEGGTGTGSEIYCGTHSNSQSLSTATSVSMPMHVSTPAATSPANVGGKYDYF